MAELLYNELPKEEVKQVDKGPEVRPISFEDALKELRDMG